MMTRSKMLAVQEYLVQQEGAKCHKPTGFELHDIQKRIMLNNYLDLFLKEVRKNDKYSCLSDIEILLTPRWSKILFDNHLDIQFDISVYELPDGCKVEFDMVSGYWGMMNDKNDWMLKLCGLFNIE